MSPRAPFMLSALSLSALALALGGCAYRSKERAVSRADLDNPSRTRMTNYMSAPVRQLQPSEKTPGAVSRSALLDEVVISKVDGTKVCFDALVRTATDLDTALSEMRVLVNDKPASFGDERINIRDYPYSGERDIMVASGVTPDAYGSMRITRPETKVLRVIERRGEVCAPMKKVPKELVLELIIVQDDNRGNWGEKFVWTIE